MKDTGKPVIRVLIIASGDLWAGAESVVHELVTGLDASTGVEPVAIIFNDGELFRKLRKSGVRTFLLDETGNGFLSLALKLILVAREIRPHIIHSHRYKENILGWITSFFAGFPRLVSTVHGMTEVERSLRSRIIVFLNTLLMRRFFHSVVVVSEDLKEVLSTLYDIPRERIVPIHNGLKRIETKSARTSGRLVIGSAGRLVPVKNYASMVRIAESICERFGHVDFVLAGEGPDEADLLESLSDPDRFRLLGHIDDMESFYDQIDIYINTSFHEGIPMSVLEAMGACLPVVAFSVGGLVEIIEDGRSGLLAGPGDEEMFCRHLERLITDAGLRHEVGIGAGERIENSFGRQAMVGRYKNMYRELVGSID